MKKLTKEQKLYIDKQLEFTEELYNKADEQLKEVYKAQLNNRNEILTEIANTMLSYNITDSKLSISIAEKKKLKEKLSKVIRDKIQDELINESNLTDEILNSTGKEKYNINNYLHDIGMNVSWDIKPVDDETLKGVINTKVDNKLWSDRLWGNKNSLQKDLKLEINDFINGKTSVNEIESKIKKKYNSNAYNIKRLVQDNVARVQESINDIWREEHNIKRVLYMATLCNNTCGNCSQYDNKDYPVDKKPVDLPQHPFCRCTYVNIPSADWRPKMRLDNETKKKINWQSYQEWTKTIKQTGGKYTRGDSAWFERRDSEAESHYDSIRQMKSDVSQISKNTGFTEKVITKIKQHVFYNNKHILQYAGIGLLDADYDMAVAWQRLINGNFEKRDILLLKHEYLESGIEKRYNLTNKQAHDITTKKYDWCNKLKLEKGEFGEDDCLNEVIRRE